VEVERRITADDVDAGMAGAWYERGGGVSGVVGWGNWI